MQLHKRLTIHQVRQALDWYEQGFMSQAEVLARLGIKRRRFFDLLKVYEMVNSTRLHQSNASMFRIRYLWDWIQLFE